MDLFYRLCLFCLALFVAGTVYAGCRIERKTMPCSLLQGISQREYSVCLPASYSPDDDRRYPVLYLLHGGGTHHAVWEDDGKLQALVDSLVAKKQMEEMIIVCPEACQDYMIWFNAPDWKYEDYFFQELMPYIDQQYKVKKGKRYCGVAGFSMGGGAAAVYGVRHPECFNMVFDMSGYLRRQPLDFLNDDPTAEERQQVVEAHNPIISVQNGTEEQVRQWRTVRWFIDCGDQDFTLEGNMDFVKALRNRQIPYRMWVRPGAHDWDFWRTSLKMALTSFSQSVYKEKVIDKGGGGPYSAIAKTEVNLPDHVIYRPQNIAYASNVEGKLPVLIFANGGCNDTSVTHERVLNEIASNGYVVIALGEMQMRLDDREIRKAPDEQIFTALDWILSENENPESDYYQCIATDRIAMGGQSCGGAQVINVAADARFKTYLMYNSGIGDMEMNGADKKKLTNFHAPVLYIIGDEEDIAYQNALKDYDRIKKVPVAFANLKDGGHMGTFDEPNGGAFARISIDWLDWQLKGRTSRSVVFLNNQLKDYPGWSIQTKKFEPIYQLTEFETRELDCVNQGKRIWGKIFVPETRGNKVPLVIIGHGYNSSYRETQPYAEALAAHGVASVIFDFCGGAMNSKSEGKTTEMSVFTESDDIMAILGEAKNWKFVDQNRLVIMGCSQGGLVASITAAAHPELFHSMILIYPALGIGYDAVNRHPKEAIHAEKFNLMGLDISHVYYDKLLTYNIFEELKKYPHQVVSIYGDQDSITANDSMDKANESLAKFETHIIAGGKHGFPNPEHLKRAVGFVVDFIGNYVIGK